jgi:hypothetical protein
MLIPKVPPIVSLISAVAALLVLPYYLLCEPNGAPLMGALVVLNVFCWRFL